MWMLELVLDVVGGGTTRLLLRVFGGGRVRVEMIGGSGRAFNAFGVRRGETGEIEIAADAAGWLGVFIWIAVLIAVLAVVR